MVDHFMFVGIIRTGLTVSGQSTYGKKNPTQHDFKRNKSHVSKPVLLTDFLEKITENFKFLPKRFTLKRKK